MFSCEFCEIFRNNFFTEHLLATASELYLLILPVWIQVFQGITWKENKTEVILKSKAADYNKNGILNINLVKKAFLTSYTKK